MVEPEQLVDRWTITERSRRGRNTVTILAWHLVDQPAIRIDNLEIVGVRWVTREEALAQPITGHLRGYLQCLGAQGASASQAQEIKIHHQRGISSDNALAKTQHDQP